MSSLKKSVCTFSSGSHWYEGNRLRVGSAVTGYVTCQHTDCLDLVLSVRVAIEQGTWLHHSGLHQGRIGICGVFVCS
jgi:hypothetical protein